MYTSTLYFVVLANIFVAGDEVIEPQEKYDLKGSYIDRHTNNYVESGKLMKDEDLHKTLKLVPTESDRVYKQLKSDTEFLSSQGIMDYSVLLGIYYVGINPSDVNNSRIMSNRHNNDYTPPLIDDNDFKSEQEIYSYETEINKYLQNDQALKAHIIEGPGIYYLGIIDMLQEWNTMKKLERFIKVYLRCKNSKGISCVEPNFYRMRFLRKMNQIGIRSENNHYSLTPVVH